MLRLKVFENIFDGTYESHGTIKDITSTSEQIDIPYVCSYDTRYYE